MCPEIRLPELLKIEDTLEKNIEANNDKQQMTFEEALRLADQHARGIQQNSHTDEAEALPPLPACLCLYPEDEARTRATFENAVKAEMMERTTKGYKWKGKTKTALAFLCGLLVSNDEKHERDECEITPRHKIWDFGIFPQNELEEYFEITGLGDSRAAKKQAAIAQAVRNGIEEKNATITPPKNYKELLELIPIEE